MKFALFRRRTNEASIERLHGEIMAASRQPALYLDHAIADTLDGRFEALALLATPPVLRLAALPEPGPALAQELTDAFFGGFDDALRETGTSDVAVPKKIKKMAAAWLGRRRAYAAALAECGDEALCAALARNVHAGRLAADCAEVRRLASYIREVVAAQAGVGLAAFVEGPAPFPPAR
jgi:cytochrome b pre-mRNA-processing protein 3